MIKHLMWLRAALVISLLVPCALATNDPDFVGMNNGTGYNTSPDYVDWNISRNKELGLGRVRMGMDNVGGFTEGEAFNFGHRDVAVDKYLAAGIKIHSVLSARGHVKRDPNYDKWKANWAYFCKNIFSHYKGKISYYIVDNETDISYGNGILSPQEAVDLTRIAYETAKSIDPTIMIESPPTTSPETTYLREMIRLGISKYCDYIGVHAYGGQINDNRLNRVWSFLNEFNIEKPVAVSEAGAIDEYFNSSGVAPSQGRRMWFANFYLQLKRYAFDHVLLFDLDGHDAWAVDKTPSYDEIRDWYRREGLKNGGFEEENDNLHGWNVFASSDTYIAPSSIRFIRNDSANASSGSGYLQMEKGAPSVRRIVEYLTPNRTYEIKARVNITGGGSASLKALGWYNLNGNIELESSTTESGWKELSIRFAPTKTWVVIDLSAKDVGAAVRWDDVTVEERPDVKPDPTPTPVSRPTPGPNDIPHDLTVTDITWTPKNPGVGDAVTFSARIKNEGGVPTPHNVIHGVAFFVDGKFISWSDNTTQALAPGESRVVTSNGGPGGKLTWTAVAGSHTVEAVVDDIDRIPGEVSEFNNKLAKNFSIDEVQTFTVDLAEGWNLFSLPIEPSNGSLSEVLSSIEGKYTGIYQFSGTIYEASIPGLPTTAISELRAGRGYWIHTTESVSFTVSGKAASRSLQLQSGWNLIGFNSTGVLTVESALSSIKGKYLVLYSFDNASNNYLGYSEEYAISDIKELRPGVGYWIYASEETTWTLP
jgi:hypothetical protein